MKRLLALGLPLLLAACGGAAPPASTVAPSAVASSAAAKPASTSPATSAPAKPAASAGAASAAGKPAASTAAKPAASTGGASAAAKPAASGALEHVKIATATISANQMPVWMAADGGSFAKDGLDAEVTGIAGSNTVVAAMVGGSLDVGQLGGPGLINAGLGGADVVMFAGFLNKEDYRLMSDPSLKTLADLKGKTVAITSFGAADDFILRKVLTENNLKPDTDVKIIAAKDTPGQMAALISKQVQAAVFGLPNYVTAQKQGASVLLDLSTQKILHQSTGLVATRGWLKNHHSAGLKLVQATTEGMQRFKADKPFAESVMSKYIKSDDKDVLDAGWESNAAAFQIPPLPSAEGIQEVLDEAKGGASHKPEEFMDTSLVQELQASGYFK